jgi:putative RNA 2'-phosphotransferase
MMESADKRRYEIQGGKIRALYGHSISGKLKKVQKAPPRLLFHGTDPAVVPQIRVSGLVPMSRQYVHLSADFETARQVGERKAKAPSVLRVMAMEAYAGGVSFYEGNEKVWLADKVPAQFITFE